MNAQREFEVMSMDKQIAWQERVIRKYPSLAELVSDLPVY